MILDIVILTQPLTSGPSSLFFLILCNQKLLKEEAPSTQ